MEPEDKKRPVIIVIFGVTGDLSHRYLLPALSKIEEAGKLPKDCRIIGITRRDVSKEQVLKDCAGLSSRFDLIKMDVPANIIQYDSYYSRHFVFCHRGTRHFLTKNYY